MSPLLQRRPDRRAVVREQRGGVAIALVLAAWCAVQLVIASTVLASGLVAGYAGFGLALALVLATDHLVALRRVDDSRVLSSCRDVARLVCTLLVLRVAVAVVLVDVGRPQERLGLAVLVLVLADNAPLVAAAAAAVGGMGHAARLSAGLPVGRPVPHGSARRQRP